MKFGQVAKPEEIDFTIPADHPDSKVVLKGSKQKDLKVYVGCAKWNKTDLKNFYPKGTKDELEYYSSQFNCIELNATFYRLFPASQFEKWKETTPEGFKFFPKLGQDISHFRRLKEVEDLVDATVTNFSHLEEKMGMPFLQMHNNFGPKDFERVKAFVDNWKFDIPLALEFRHTDWYNNPEISAELYDLLEKNEITNVLVDTAGRRDLMHMRLTTPRAFVRWVGANHPSDYTRLDGWIERIAGWKKQGLSELNFFIHQNIEKESPLLSAYFIKKLNKRIGTDLQIPKTMIPAVRKDGELYGCATAELERISIIRTNSENANFTELVNLLDAELRIRDGDEHSFYAQFNKIDSLTEVVVAYSGDTAIGCGAIKRYDGKTAEVKRMFVKPESRGKGVAGRILAELEAWAKELNFDECILETGFKQPEAIALYKRSGYEVISNYGQYAGVANSVCMKKHVG